MLLNLRLSFHSVKFRKRLYQNLDYIIFNCFLILTENEIWFMLVTFLCATWRFFRIYGNFFKISFKRLTSQLTFDSDLQFDIIEFTELGQSKASYAFVPLERFFWVIGNSFFFRWHCRPHFFFVRSRVMYA